LEGVPHQLLTPLFCGTSFQTAITFVMPAFRTCPALSEEAGSPRPTAYRLLSYARQRALASVASISWLSFLSSKIFAKRLQKIERDKTSRFFLPVGKSLSDPPAEGAGGDMRYKRQKSRVATPALQMPEDAEGDTPAAKGLRGGLASLFEILGGHQGTTADPKNGGPRYVLVVRCRRHCPYTQVIPNALGCMIPCRRIIASGA